VSLLAITFGFPLAAGAASLAYARLARVRGEAAWPSVRERIAAPGGAYRGSAVHVARAGQPTGLARTASFGALLAAACALPAVGVVVGLADPERAGGLAVLVVVPALGAAVAHARAGAAILREGPAAAPIALRAGLCTLLVAFWVSAVAAALADLSLRAFEPCVVGALAFGVFLLGVAVMLVAAAAHLAVLRDNVR
jgi:hypothetical protein